MLRTSFPNSRVNQVLLSHRLHPHIPSPTLLKSTSRQSTILTKVMGTRVRNPCRVWRSLLKERTMNLWTTSINLLNLKTEIATNRPHLHQSLRSPVPAPPLCVPSSMRSNSAMIRQSYTSSCSQGFKNTSHCILDDRERLEPFLYTFILTHSTFTFNPRQVLNCTVGRDLYNKWQSCHEWS